MLPPIQISQNSVAYQVRRTDGFDSGQAGPTPPATAVSPEQAGLDIRSAIAGRVSILLLSGPERTAESFTIMAELFGRSLGIARRENETQASYMRRLAEALQALPQAKRQIVEQQLSQLFNELALKTVIGAFADPAGPDAAIMTMHLEIAEDGDGQTPTKFALASYQPDGEDTDGPAHSVRPSPLVQARTDAGPMHLRIVASSDYFDVRHASASDHPVAPASRPSIDIRGTSDNAESAHAAAEFSDAAPDRPGRALPRITTQVTIDITGRAQVDDAPEPPVPHSRRLALGNEWRTTSQDPTSEEPGAEIGDTAAKADIVDQRPAGRRNAADTEDPARTRMEAIAAGQSQPTATPSPAIRVENDAEDALGKFLRASLAASYLPARSDSEEQQAWREREAILSDRPGLASTDAAQLPEPIAETSSAAERMESATRPHPSESQILPRPETGQALLFREPVGFPAIGYPYADEEESGRPSERRPQEDDERWRENEGDGSAGQQDMSGQQDDETGQSPDEAAPASSSASDDEPAMMLPQRGISDSANDLYWKMAGWA
ncbi:hypothetical protein M8R20_17010 [Pseudomonas sp. R2.Fl]|nr:hypothetical protein [Pseudomonas sp. R2.Fl]